jgi:hypothetical protein
MEDLKIGTGGADVPASPSGSQTTTTKADDAGATASTTATAPAKKPSKFGQIMGSLLGGALNVIAPGAGSLIGGLINGGGSDFGSMNEMLERSAQQQMQMLMIQERVQTQTQEFTTISNLLKARHDGEMAAVHNFKS